MEQTTNRVVMLTTIDNPYDPFEDFDNWYKFDEIYGYHSCGLLARIAYTSSAFPDSYNQKIIEDAIDEIIQFDMQKVYKKVVKEIRNDDELVT